MRINLFVVSAVTLLASAIAFAEQTGTPRRLIAGDYDKKRIAIVAPDGKIEWDQKISGSECHDLQVLPNGNILYQQSWTKIVEMTPAHKVVWSYDSATMNGNAGKAVQVHAFRRLPDGKTTMLAESGVGRIIEVDAAGKLLKEIKLKVSKSDPHRDTRLVRKLDNGHYLVAHEGDNAVREYDDAGKVVWEYAVGSRVYSATRLKNGNTLIGAGDGHRVIEVDPAGKTVWSLNEHDLPGGVTLAWVTMVDRLPSGNTLVVNCHAGPTNPQIIEVTPDKKVVWSFKDFDHFGNALPVALLLPEAR
jgi:outer membrane protein assembly factor BamB